MRRSVDSVELPSEDSDDSFEPPQKDEENALLKGFIKEWLGTMQRDGLMLIYLVLHIVPLYFILGQEESSWLR